VTGPLLAWLFVAALAGTVVVAGYLLWGRLTRWVPPDMPEPSPWRGETTAARIQFACGCIRDGELPAQDLREGIVIVRCPVHRGRAVSWEPRHTRAYDPDTLLNS
jgi:hypothetical protein